MKRNRVQKVFASRHNDRGGTLLEFGLVMLVFCMFVFGVMDFGRAFYAYNFVNNAASRATRYAIVHGAESSTPVTATDIADYVKGIVPPDINPSDVDVSATWSPNNDPGSNVRVQVSDNFHFTLPMLPTYGLTLTGTSQMVISH